MTNDLSVNAKGSMSEAPAHGTVCCFQGAQFCTRTHERWFWDMAAFTYFKSSGTFGCKKK